MIRHKIPLIAFVYLFFAGCSIVSNTDHNILRFENYSTGMELPPDFFSLDSRMITDSVFFNKKLLIQPPPESQRVTGELFDFLNDLDLINGWSIYKEEINPDADDRNEYIESHKKNHNFFCIGEVKIRDEFQSFLFLLITGVDDAYFVSRDLYLMNVKDNKCKSLTVISSYGLFSGESIYHYTERLSDNLFIHKCEFTVNTVLLEKILDNAYSVRFKYDKEGMIKILSTRVREYWVYPDVKK